MDTTRQAAAAVRSTHILHIAPPEPVRLANLARRSSRAPATEPAIRTLVLTSDAETAAATANAAGLDETGQPVLVALTGAARAARVLATSRPDAVVTPFDVAAALLQRSSLPLTAVRQAIVAMPDTPNDPRTRESLDAVMAELPRDTVRTLVAAAETPEVEALVTRHFFKARRTGEQTEAVVARAGMSIRTLTTSSSARWETLRRLFDEFDPASAVVLTSPDEHAQAVRLLATMGYAGNTQVQAVRDDIPASPVLVAVIGLPEPATLRRAIAASPIHLVVLCAPREIRGLRVLAQNVPVTPWVLAEPRARAADREAATRTRLREILASGAYGRELLNLTPLLDEYDPSEVAAAALVLAAEIERRTPAPPPPPPAAPPPSAPPRREAGPRDRPPRRQDGPPRRDRR